MTRVQIPAGAFQQGNERGSGEGDIIHKGKGRLEASDKEGLPETIEAIFNPLLYPLKYPSSPLRPEQRDHIQQSPAVNTLPTGQSQRNGNFLTPQNFKNPVLIILTKHQSSKSISKTTLLSKTVLLSTGNVNGVVS